MSIAIQAFHASSDNALNSVGVTADDGKLVDEKLDSGIDFALFSKYWDTMPLVELGNVGAPGLGADRNVTVRNGDQGHGDESTQVSTDTTNDLLDILWVPAHKHPELAPGEFANWIETQGTAPVRKASKVKRQKSKLSTSVSYEDKQEMEPEDTHASDPPEAAESTMQARALSRRVALSARGRTRPETKSKSDTAENKASEWSALRYISERLDKPLTEGITLEDQPVSMSEWIDLGSAGLNPSSNGILSRVQDAESLLLTELNETDTPPTDIPENRTVSFTPTPRPEPMKRTKSVGFLPDIQQKRWLSGLLPSNHSKPKGAPHPVKANDTVTRPASVASLPLPEKKKGFASFISRTLSRKTTPSSSAKKESRVSKTKASLPTATSMPDVSDRMCIRTDRLPIHLERAIYKLSHMKLANPRRPLHQQVVISNLMFWYLSIIHSQQQFHHQPSRHLMYPQHTSPHSPHSNAQRYSLR